MEFKLIFVDGATMTYNTAGILVGVTHTDGTVEDHTGYSLGNGCPDIEGIWDDDERYTIPWTKVVDYEHTGFELTSCMFLDNGQVVEEGEIVKIEVTDNGNEVITWTIQEDDIEWYDNNNVYCEACDTQYVVMVDANMQPTWCTFCGSKELHIKGDN